jgi:hypothetical protein
MGEPRRPSVELLGAPRVAPSLVLDTSLEFSEDQDADAVVAPGAVQPAADCPVGPRFGEFGYNSGVQQEPDH